MACTFQEGAGSPVGVAVPKFIGQLYHDTTNDQYWRSTGLANTDWVLIAPIPFVEWLPHTEMATWNDSGGDGQVGDYTTFLANADLNTLSNLNLSSTAITGLVCNNLPELILLDTQSCPGLTDLDVTGCTNIVFLICNYSAITPTITGIQTCISLHTLLAPYNSLTSLNLSGLNALTAVDCGHNSLTSLLVTGCDRLFDLFCYYNQLTSLDISTCTNIQQFLCNNNLITSLNVSGCARIVSIICSYNSMLAAAVDTVLCDVDASAFTGGSLDITNNNPPTAAGLLCASNAGGHLTDPARVGGPWTVTHD